LEVLPRRTAARGGPRSPAASGRGARAGPCSAREVLCARPSQKHCAVMAAWGRRAHRGLAVPHVCVQGLTCGRHGCRLAIARALVRRPSVLLLDEVRRPPSQHPSAGRF